MSGPPPDVLAAVLRDQSDPSYMAHLARQRYALMQSHRDDEAAYEATGIMCLVRVVNMDKAAA